MSKRALAAIEQALTAADATLRRKLDQTGAKRRKHAVSTAEYLLA